MGKVNMDAKKEKRLRNAEKRRERSKVAARCRRGKEAEIFTFLSSSVPILEEQKSSLDKAQVMRLTISDLKLRKIMSQAFPETVTEVGRNNNEFADIMKWGIEHGGSFLLILALDGDVIFASEGVTTQLGIAQYEIMGQSILDFTHQYDHQDIRRLLKKDDGQKRSTLFRMKSTVSARGRNAHLRAQNFKVINCMGRIIGEKKGERCFISFCEPLLHPSDVDIPLNKQSFVSRHSPDMKFECADESVGTLLGYEENELKGQSFFKFLHALDGEKVGESFKSLYEKEQAITERYRFLAKGGGWVWLTTQATLIHNNGGSSKDPGSVVCIHFITSGREEASQILSEVQLVKVIEKENLPVPVSSCSEEEQGLLTDLLVGPLLNNATCSTSKIFAPRTKEMEKGFCVPKGEGLEEDHDPEDLTHLAPIAGDGCVLIEDVPLLEDFLTALDETEEIYTILEADSPEIQKLDLKMNQQTTPYSQENNNYSTKFPTDIDSLFHPYNNTNKVPVIGNSDLLSLGPKRRLMTTPIETGNNGSYLMTPPQQFDLIDLLHQQQPGMVLLEQFANRKRDSGGARILENKKFSLLELTREDCEVNAPLGRGSDLLHGPDLLHALDIGP